MVDINFTLAGEFEGTNGDPDLANKPTSLQFGPDGRLYVSDLNGSISAFTIATQAGEYTATAAESIDLVKQIQNHNDDGSANDDARRQVTGIVVSGTEANPVLYVSSSDPRTSDGVGDLNLDTNSGVITRLTWTGTDWDAVDIVRGLPRSEENHSTNGMVLSADGTKLYVAQGGNTNNGAPSSYFSYAAEYALSGTVLEIDLIDIDSRPVLTDPMGSQGGTPRQYVYDLPTLDDPSVANDGIREDAEGMDTAGPWGGNDGLNMSVLPADAPLRVYASGFRNHYDLVLSESGQLYTVDNGSNEDVGGDPIKDINNQATSTPNNGGVGDPEPLFLIEEGGYYGHPNPILSNQSLSWTAYDDSGNPDVTLSPNTVPNLSELVPAGVNIQPGFLVDPSKFTGDAAQLAEIGNRVKHNSPQSKSLVNLGSSSNGLAEYTGDAFNGAIKGALLVTQFNGNVTLLNLNEAGTDVVPLVTAGDDGIIGTSDDVTVDGKGFYQLLGGFSLALDVTVADDGSIWVADLASGLVKAFAPTDAVLPDDLDFDNDGINNVFDPFIRDSTNGSSALVLPGIPLQWDFDPNQDGNLPGPGGYGGGLTGVMLDNVTDYETFFQSPSTLLNQDIKIDNVKFVTAAGGGTITVENVSKGTPKESINNGEYLFQTGVKISPTVETFTVKWSIVNPAAGITGPEQQVGGYIGTGDQSNYLKVVTTQNSNGEIRVSLEDNDVIQADTFLQADDIFTTSNPGVQKIFLALIVDLAAETATPTVTYETDTGNQTVTGAAISLAGTAVLEAINGNNQVAGQEMGLAVGLFSTNDGEPAGNTFQAIFDDIEITATTNNSTAVLYRVNAGGEAIAAIDGGPNWAADMQANNSAFLAVPGSNDVSEFSAVRSGDTVAATTPESIFSTERWDFSSAPEMQWAFDTPVAGAYEVRLFMGNGYGGTSGAGSRVFDVEIEGVVPTALDNIDLSQQFGHEVGGMIAQTVLVTDGQLNITFGHEVENPLVNGIEIIQLGGDTPILPRVSLAKDSFSVDEGEGQVQVAIATNIPVPSDETVSVSFEVLPLTATPGEDYVLPNGTLDPGTGIYSGTMTIPGGTANANIGVDILQDTLEETDEAFTINLTGVSSNAQMGASAASITIKDDDTIIPPGSAIYRVNAGGQEIVATDGGPNWAADMQASNNAFLVTAGSNDTAEFAVQSGATVAAIVPDSLFFTERWDSASAPSMQWAFDTPTAGQYEVRLFMGNGFDGTSAVGNRVFDVFVEGTVPTNFDNIDLSAQFGHRVGGMISQVVSVADGTLNLEFSHGVENPLINGIEIVQLGDMPSPPDMPPSQLAGAAIVRINPNENDVQTSTFGANTFQIENVGNQKITSVKLDVTNAIYSDVVFDPFGIAGDTFAKPITIDTNGSTGVLAPGNASYIGTGGIAGFEGIELTFDEGSDGGFEPGESIGFSVDTDPNSIAGADKLTLDTGTNPSWDVGGVSGAMLIGSAVQVTFEDGTVASSQLQGTGNQASSQTLADQNAAENSVVLAVNGLNAGENGTYSESQPSVVVNGIAGQTARVVLTKGFIQPIVNNFTDPYKSQLDAQLSTLAASTFPANNAAEFQTVDVLLTGEDQDISDQFNLSDVAIYSFAGEDQLPLGFVAGVVDPARDSLPIGSVTQPIYLQFVAEASGPLALFSETEGIDALTGMDSVAIAGQSGDFLTSPNEPLLSIAGFTGEMAEAIAGEIMPLELAPEPLALGSNAQFLEAESDAFDPSADTLPSMASSTLFSTLLEQ